MILTEHHVAVRFKFLKRIHKADAGCSERFAGKAQEKLKADAYSYTRGFELFAATPPAGLSGQPAGGG